MQPLRVLVSANKSYTSVRDVPPVIFVMLFVQALTLILLTLPISFLLYFCDYHDGVNLVYSPWLKALAPSRQQYTLLAPKP